MTDSHVIRQLYRSLYRLAAKIGNNSSLAASIYRIRNNSAALSPTNPKADYYNHVLGKVFGKRNFFLPPQQSSLKDVIRQEFHAVNDRTSVEDRVDVAFMFLRKFSSIWKGFADAHDDNANEDDKEQRDRTDLESVEQLPRFELLRDFSEFGPGIVLAAHPMLGGPLHRSVVLLLQHSPEGSYGIVINRPTTRNLSKAVVNLPPEFNNRFGKAKVRFGGMVRRMQVLHSVPTAGGSEIPFCSEKGPGLFASVSLPAATAHVRKYPQDLSQFTFFVGCCIWEPGQLEKEVEAGYWIPNKSQPDLVLKSVLGTDNGGPKRKRFRQGALVDDFDLYQFLLRSLGDDFRGLTEIPHWMDSSMLEACDATV